MSETPPTLTPEHVAHLRTSGLTDETLALAGLYSLTKPTDVARALGYEKWRGGGGAIVFPVRLPGRTEVAALRLRPDCPRKRKRDDAPIKYDQRPTDKGGPGIVIYFPPRTLTERLNVGEPVVWTEGEKKALLLDQLGFATVGLAGVDCFHDKPAKDRGDGLKLHPWVLEHLSIEGRIHFICFDSDARNKDGVLFAARKLAGLLKARGAFQVRFIDIPDQGSEKFGVDDFFVKFGDQATRALFQTTREVDAISPELPLMSVRDVAAFREAPATISQHLRIPDGYDLGRDGSLWEKPQNDGPIKCISTAAPVVATVLFDDDHHERLELIARSSSGAWRSVTVPRGTVLAGGIRAVELLGNLGLEVLPRADIGSWLSAFERENGQRIPRARITGRAGWHGEGEDRVFLLGMQALDGEGKPTTRVRFDEGGSQEIARTFRPGGEAGEHARLLRGAMEASDVAAAAIYASFAAPLLHRLGVAPFGFHLWGKSSRGKTTVLQLATGVYGSPMTHGEDSAIASWDGTLRGLELYAQTCSDLPVCLDESSTVQDREKRERAIYQVINGRGGLASKRDGSGLRTQRAWRTVLLSTGEQSLTGGHARTGAQVRTIEVYVDGLGALTATDVDDLKSRAVKHFGHMGREWIKALLRLDDAAWANARERYDQVLIELRTRCAPHSLAARQTGFFALLVLAERMVARLIGLGDVEGTRMMRFAGAEEMRIGVVPEEVRAAQLLLDWIASEPGAFPEVKPSASVGAGDTSAHEPRERDATGHGFAGFRGVFKGERALFLIDTPVDAKLAEHGLDLRACAREWVRLGVAMVQDPHLKPKVRIGGGGATRHWTLSIAKIEALCEGPQQRGGPNHGPNGPRDLKSLPGGKVSGDSGDKSGAQTTLRSVPSSQWGQNQSLKPPESLGKSVASPASPLLPTTNPVGDKSRPEQVCENGAGTVSRAPAGVSEISGDSGDRLTNYSESLDKVCPQSRPQCVPTFDGVGTDESALFSDETGIEFRNEDGEDDEPWSADRCAAETG